MAQWKETLEPYVKVQEKIKTAAINPVAGEDLIIGAVIISDAGPSVPTLITSQTEFLNTFSSQELSEDYVNSMNRLYKGEDHTLASTVWLNAYRLAGSANLLVVRASKAKDIYFAKPLVKNDNNVYLLRDGQLLKKIPSFKIVIDKSADQANDTAASSSDGWSININEIGIIGNRSTDDGAQYDYYVQNLVELVDYLNDTSKFFSPSYTFYSDDRGTVETTVADDVVSVVFNEVYVGVDIIDTTDERCPDGLAYVITCQPDWTSENPKQKIVNLNDTAYSHFDEVPFYTTNNYNSSTDLKVRIRRFNHDAVLSKELDKNDVYAGGESPYNVLTSVLDVFTKKGTITPKDEVLERDFYEVAVLDPSLDADPLYFNVGNIEGRGDIDEATLNESLKMIQLQLPDNLADLGLDYYGYLPSNKKAGWVTVNASEVGNATPTSYATKTALYAATGMHAGDFAVVGKKSADYYKYDAVSASWVTTSAPTDGAKYHESSLELLKSHILSPAADEVAQVGNNIAGTYYQYKDGVSASDMEPEEIYVDLSIDPSKYSILDVSDTDMINALDQITKDEVYVTEGLTDLGNTSAVFQANMASVAVKENYFYAASTVNSTNYLTIANGTKRLSQDSCKLYTSAPWDIDTGTVGFKYYAAPSTLYWEAVCRNRTLDREFASVFGFGATGVVTYQNPVVEFNKKQRQLLLSKKVNTVLWNTQGQTWNMNDSYTKQSENNIMSEDGNSRLAIRISKAQPQLLRQFIGRKINDVLYADMQSVIDYWFQNTIMTMDYTIDAYRITIADINTDEDKRANRVRVLIEVRYQRSLKFVEVLNYAFDMGMEFTGKV